MALPDLDNTSTPVSVALEQIEAQDRAWIRALAVRSDGNWAARVVEIVTGAPPPAWEEVDWTYTEAWLLAIERPGGEVRAMLQAGVLRCDDREIALPSPMDTVHWIWRASEANYGPCPLPWPSWTAQLTSTIQQNEPWAPLIADGVPSWASFVESYAYVFCGAADAPMGQVLPQVLYRHQVTDGRIVTVEFGKEATVVLRGCELAGMTVELAGKRPGPVRVLQFSDEEAVEFPLSEGIERGAWVALRRGRQLVDRRSLVSQYPYGAEPGVSEVVDVGSRLELLVSMREGPTVEFKAVVPVDDKEKNGTMRTVAAFANGQGGSILFGVDDDYNVNGVDKAQSGRLMDTLSQIVESWVDPEPPINLRVLPIPGEENREVIELEVQPGITVYYCGKQNRERRPYVRVHGRTVPARREEVEAIVIARRASPPQSGYGFPGLLG